MKDRTQFLSLVIGAALVTALIWGLSATDAVSPGMVVTIAILAVVVLPAFAVIMLDKRSRVKSTASAEK